MVYSDVVGPAEAMGGNAVAVERLDAFFRKPDGTFDLSATKGTRFDATNEPDIQTPFLYNYFRGRVQDSGDGTGHRHAEVECRHRRPPRKR
jgi:putative alpha-1,2-mannosidase